jgi:hypothetical protein
MNLIGDDNPDIKTAVFRRTDLLNFIDATIFSNKIENTKILKLIAWSLSLIGRVTDRMSVEEISLTVKLIKKLLKVSNESMQSDLLWALSYMTESTVCETTFKYLKMYEMFPMLIVYLNGLYSPNIFNPCLRLLGNCATSEDITVCLSLLDADILYPLF